MERGTAHEWLQQLDALNPVDEAWRDPEFCASVSWLMICFIPRRMGQLLINAGAEAVTGTDYSGASP